MTWKTALLTALKNRSRRDVVRAVIVAAPATVLGSLGQDLGTGLGLGTWMLVMVFVINVIDDARKARKRARREAARVSD
jgi:cell division protein FtsW (lipid II flippase)